MTKWIRSGGVALFTFFSLVALAQPGPTITQNPSSQSVIVGSNTTFTVAATGQTPAYYWFGNGTNLVDNARFGGTRTPTLNIANVIGEDAGNYYVVVSNRHGTATSSTASLTVLFPPEITTPPTAQSVILGNNASFSVVAVGTAPLSYHWTKDGVELLDDSRVSGSFTDSLSITDIQANDGGTYRVIISNVVGTNSSAEVALTILVPPSITEQPVGQSHAVGSTANFSVTATGDAPLSYRWLFNGTNLVDDARITGALTSSLSISNLQSSDEGTYWVAISNSVGGVASEPVQLSLLFPPTFAQQPQSQVITNGAALSLAGTVNGTAPISYQWFFNGAAITNDTRIVGADSAVLSVSNVQSNDAGNYQLVASNAYGAATSDVATITVVVPPVIIEHPTNRTAVSGTGDSTTFHVGAEGTEPLGYQWYWNNSPLTDNANTIGATTSNLTITNISSASAGDYFAVVANQFGAATSSVANLTVLLPPSISQQPFSQSAPIGLPVTLTVTAQGTATLAYQWSFNGSSLAGATTTKLELGALNGDKVGQYQVVVTNQAGSVTSAVAQVTFGSVAAWGKNTFRESSPPPGLSNVFAVAGVFNGSYGVETDGSLIGWGSVKSYSNTTHVGIAASTGITMLRADGTISTAEGFVTHPTTNVVQVAIGQNHTVALRREGTITFIGQQGPIIPTWLNNIAAVAAGPFHSLALKSNGTVVAWGLNAGTNVPPGLNNVSAIAAGPTHGLALKSNGTVVAWGTGPAATVPPGLSNVVAISAANYSQSASHNLALRADGRVVAWGNNNQFGETNVPPGLSNVIAISAAPLHSLAIVGDGRPIILRPPVGGRASFGGEFAFHGKATGVEPMSYQWSVNGTNIVGATNSSLTLTNVAFSHAGNYSLFVSNALGTLTTVPALMLVEHVGPRFLSFEGNKTVYRHGRLVLDPTVIGSGKMGYQWRFNNTNIFGATNRVFSIAHAEFTNAGTYTLVATNYLGTAISPPMNVQVLGPVAIWNVSSPYGIPVLPPQLTNAIAIAAGNEHGLALLADGTVVGFGSNTYGQTNVPAGLSNVVEIAAGGNQSLALRANGTVVGWGSAPINELSSNSNIVSMTASSFGLILLRTNGTATTIGSGPLPPSTATNIISLARFDDGHFGLREDGTVYSVGGGFPPPTIGNKIMEAAAVRYHGTLLRRDGVILEWGTPTISNSASGVISLASTLISKWAVDGDGTVVLLGKSDPVPVPVPPNLTSVSVIDAGANYLLALTTKRDLSSLTLSQATETEQLVVSSKGSAQWFAQTNVHHDGVDAARSANIGGNTASSMRMFVPGPATVRFWWKVSSQTNSDHLSVSVGLTEQASISGAHGWEQRSINIPSGRHIVVWKYAKDSSGTEGDDTGWVDGIEILPPAPTITRQPFDRNVLSGTSVQIPVSASGATPLFYRWFKNGQPIPTGTNSIYNIASATRSHSGSYSVTVSNAIGSVTSSNAILKVIAPQVFSALSFTNGMFVLNSGDSDGGLLSESELPFFQAQTSSNLVNWQVLSNSLSISNGLLRLHDVEATNAPSRFYRIVETW